LIGNLELKLQPPKQIYFSINKLDLGENIFTFLSKIFPFHNVEVSWKLASNKLDFGETIPLEIHLEKLLSSF